MRFSRRFGFAFGLLAACGAGCKSFFAPRGIPNDPLVVSRQPIESKGLVTVTAREPYREPTPPPGR